MGRTNKRHYFPIGNHMAENLGTLFAITFSRAGEEKLFPFPFAECGGAGQIDGDHLPVNTLRKCLIGGRFHCV